MSEPVAKEIASKEEEEIVKAIEKIAVDFNKSIEDLAEAEYQSLDISSEVFKVFVGSSDEEERSKTIVKYVETSQDLLRKQTKAFKLLQKFRTTHIAYLSNVIQSLQLKVKELSEPSSSS
jgi:phage terminase small subunit